MAIPLLYPEIKVMEAYPKEVSPVPAAAMSTETKSPSANLSKTSFKPSTTSTAAIYLILFPVLMEKIYPIIAPKAAPTASRRLAAATAAAPKGASPPNKTAFAAAKLIIIHMPVLKSPAALSFIFPGSIWLVFFVFTSVIFKNSF